MQLSTDTWHYRNFRVWQRRTRTLRHADLVPYEHRRVLARIENDGPARQPDLCTYTRIVLLWGPLHRMVNWFSRNEWVFPALMLSIFYFGFVGIGYGIAEQEGIVGWWFPWLMVPGVLIGMICGLLGVVAGLLYTIDKWEDRRKRTLRGEVQPSIVSEYVKARKRKICPLIEFEEEA